MSWHYKIAPDRKLLASLALASCGWETSIGCFLQVRRSPDCGVSSPVLRSSTRPSLRGRTQVRIHLSRGRCRLSRALTPSSVCLSVCLRGKRLLRQDAARWVWSAATFWTSEGVFSFLTSFPKNTQRSISFRSAAGFSPQHTVSPAGSAWSCVTKWTPPLTSTGLHKSLELNLSWDSWIAGNTLLNTTLQRCI